MRRRHARGSRGPDSGPTPDPLSLCHDDIDRINGIHRHQTPPRSRNAASGYTLTVSRHGVHASPYGPLQPNVTSFIKPEVHNVSQRRQRRTEPRPQWIYAKNSWRSVQRFQRYARGQTVTRDVRTGPLTRSQAFWASADGRGRNFAFNCGRGRGHASPHS